MRITFFSQSKLCTDAIWKEFKDVADEHIDVTHGLLKELPGGDALVAPGNGWGVMTGGLDLAIRDEFGIDLQDAVQNRILAKQRPMYPGEAIGIDVKNKRYKILIYAPTMYTPQQAEILDVYYAMTAILSLARNTGLESIYIPSLGTGVGGLTSDDSASAMRAAYDGIKRLDQLVIGNVKGR